MIKIVDMFDSEWERQAIEAEIACGGVVTGRLGSPNDYPPVGPVEEDEETLRQFLRDKLKEMLDREAALKTQCSFPNVILHDGVIQSGVNLAQC